MESFTSQNTHKKCFEALDRTGKHCVLRASGDDGHARASRFHPRLQILDASKRLELVPRSTRSVRMRDGVFQILLKLFVGALDQQLRVMSLPNERRDLGQANAHDPATGPSEFPTVSWRLVPFSLPSPLIADPGANKNMRLKGSDRQPRQRALHSFQVAL